MTIVDWSIILAGYRDHDEATVVSTRRAVNGTERNGLHIVLTKYFSSHYYSLKTHKNNVKGVGAAVSLNIVD